MGCIDTSIFELFKIGPGPSSSHTIGPMRAANAFLKAAEKVPAEKLAKADKIEVHLFGSLSATGKGHGTDLVMLGLGCVLGSLVGLLVLPIAGIPLSLGTGGGVLVAGLFFGWLRSLHPTFGQIPDGAQWLLNNFGLSLFVACVGLSSGRQALSALQVNGLSVFLAGVMLAFVPIIAGVIFGKYILKMNPVLLLGALTGARVIPPALNALEEDAESNTLALGFAAPFAFANVFLTVMGSVIINLM
jgi:putative transport protein